jgi:hypothetical protein
VWDWTRAAKFQWDLRAQELGSATEEPDGKRPAYTLPIAFVNRPAASAFHATNSVVNEPAASAFHATN